MRLILPCLKGGGCGVGVRGSVESENKRK